MDGNDHNEDGAADTTTTNITTWIDKSGNARHADTKVGDPQFKAGILNGLGVIDFDGGDLIRQSNNARTCTMMQLNSPCLESAVIRFR